jgi:hypothetical protein
MACNWWTEGFSTVGYTGIGPAPDGVAGSFFHPHSPLQTPRGIPVVLDGEAGSRGHGAENRRSDVDVRHSPHPATRR